MATKKKTTKSFDDEFLDLMDDFRKIQLTRNKTFASSQKEKKNASIKTASKVPELESRLLELEVLKFEKFIEAILLVRNIVTKGSYKKRHFLSEVENYIVNKQKYVKSTNPAKLIKRNNK